MTYKRPSKIVPRPYDTDPVANDVPDDGKAYMAIVASLPCAVCALIGMEQEGKTYVHHLREGQGLSKRSQSELTMPLCYECHQGRHGVHGDKSRLRLAKVDELDLVALTIGNVMRKIGWDGTTKGL